MSKSPQWREWRDRNMKEAEHQIIAIEDQGHSVQRSTDFHWVIDDKIEVWPSTKKYMVRGQNRSRDYRKLNDIFNG